MSGIARTAGRCSFGSSPIWMTKTRFAVSANTASVAPHVHWSCPGSCESGFGQSAAT